MDILSGVVALMRAVSCPWFEVAGDRHVGGGGNARFANGKLCIRSGLQIALVVPKSGLTQGFLSVRRFLQLLCFLLELFYHKSKGRRVRPAFDQPKGRSKLLLAQAYNQIHHISF